MTPKVMWFEISAKDPAKVAEFYKQAFGWEIEEFPGMAGYWLIKTGIGPKGEGPGIDGAVGTGTPLQKVVNTIGVDDIDKAIEKAVKAGAKIAEPKMKIPKVGYLAYLTDPEGALFGIIQPDMEAM